MNTCLWCNNSVSERDTVWVRKNLLLGYKFCSRRCASQWQNVNNNPQTNTSVAHRSIEELQLEQEEKRLLRKESKQEDQENAEKIMKLVTHLYPHRKWLVPVYILGLIASLFLVNKVYQSVVVIAFAIPVIAVIWGYFTVNKR